MEMYQIRYFLAAAKTLNFTRAAVDCNVSQPALTKAIKILESDLGSSLFHREGKRVLLSGFGTAMLPHLRQIITEAEMTRSLASNFRLLKQVPVRLGVMSTVGHMRLARLLGQFQRDFDGVEVSVSEGSIDDLKTRLDDGDLDLAILNPMDSLGDGFRVQHLYTERYVVIFASDHRLAQFDAIKLADLAGEAYVDRLSCEMREMVTKVCQDRQVQLYARFRSEREDWIQAMVLARIGFAFMPEYSVTLPGLLQRPLVEPAVNRNIALVNMPGRQHSPAVAALARAAQIFAWLG